MGVVFFSCFGGKFGVHIAGHYFIKLRVIMFSDNSTMEENCRSLHQEYAVQLALDMFGLLAERCTQLLHTHIESGDCQVGSSLCTHYLVF